MVFILNETVFSSLNTKQTLPQQDKQTRGEKKKREREREETQIQDISFKYLKMLSLPRHWIGNI